eukprot:CAMPEP_0179247130 /NCGR_PEP_ID=MMETSP0797-20121207/19449_1 /TAXON_ID=47934 /ORGANISM="Dinophysis acuminata, Strain DAEP01" /LENGTH=318 /DNA_ID=CAMNT_0020954737 /DNA_START=56 /DNA_END=1012 /DNA_ORIENTATION=+
MIQRLNGVGMKLVTILLSVAAELADSNGVETYNVHALQWNIHGECFNPCEKGHGTHCDRAYPKCKMNATAFLKHLMEKSSPDFAAIEQLEDAEFLDHGMPPDRWGQFRTQCGGDYGFGKYPFDVAVLYYDKTKWEPLGGKDNTYGGCMERVWHASENNYRAYVMRAFQRRENPQDQMIVVGAHYSHAVYGLDMLRMSLKVVRESSGVQKVLMLADTNRERSISSDRIMRTIYPETASVVSAEALTTCCFPRFQHAYDRIIAANFPGGTGFIHTSLPFGFHNAPAWSAFNMHDPIAGSFTYTCCAAAGATARRRLLHVV